MENWHGGAFGMARGDRAAARHPRAARATRSTTPSSRPGAQAGFETTDDYNGAKQEGFGPMEADGLARPALVRGQRLPAPGAAPGNVGVLRCLAERVVFAEGRAIGVEVDPRGGRRGP